MGIKDVVNKIHNKREKLEDKLADILEKIDGSEKVDEIEEKLIATAIEYVVNQYGGSGIDDDVYKKVSKKVVKFISKANKKLQAQLRKR